MTVCGISKADGVCVMGECPYIKKCCPAVWDKRKPQEMTNEEYLKSLNTEQLAKALKEMTDKCATCDTNQYDQIEQCPFEICRIGLNEFVEWLKQPHKGE